VLQWHRKKTALVPVQLSPERLQSIGLKTGRVESKVVEDEIRVTGNVAVDETRLSTVQLRYSGYIQKVFADATYQYLRKGQPLFTIYSPDLVATEREYLVAKAKPAACCAKHRLGCNRGSCISCAGRDERLKTMGRLTAEIARLESTGEVQKELEVDSPVSGYITERNALRISPFSRRRVFIPSPISPPFGCSPKCFKTIWEESKSRPRFTHGRFLSGPGL